ncbi:MAG TPA: HNH endonuclease [Thermoanaerobaculia bacterium]|nr:HNH endonuclease [Thermoanaerobaculia bacterium]
MRGFIANTDYDWFTYLRSLEPAVDEVNFWKPGAASNFRALQPGEPLFFKLKVPHNAIGGFGYFAHYSRLPVSMAWEVYGQANGAPNFTMIRERLLRFRNRFEMETDPRQDFWIGCVLINQPTFFDQNDWVQMPVDWSSNIVQGKGYDLSSGEGLRIWTECLGRAEARYENLQKLIPMAVTEREPYGSPAIIYPRLGQRSFRVAVLDSYGRRCAVTSERTLPALEAAHIRDYHDLPSHSINNGILFRADIHKLFDAGYVTVTPEHRFEVSRRIKEEFENGRQYYALHGTEIRLPENPSNHPMIEALWWHNEQRYLG